MKGAPLTQLAVRGAIDTIGGADFWSELSIGFSGFDYPLGLALDCRLVIGGNFRWLVFRGRYNRASPAVLLRLNSSAVKRP